MKQKTRKNKKRVPLPLYATAAIFIAVTVIAWLLPLRPTSSDDENRELRKFPEFSEEALIEGTYFRDIEEWFADTFTFRELWVRIGQETKNLYGLRSVALYEIDADKPAQADNSFEDAEYVGHTAVLQVGNAVYGYPVFSEACAGEYADCVNGIAAQLAGEASVYDVIVPENGSYKLSVEEMAKYNYCPEDEEIEYIYSLLDERVKKVDALGVLKEHGNEYVAFRTDHHWTALGAYYTYTEWCRQANKRVVPLKLFAERRYEGFLGTFSYLAERNHLLAAEPDTVVAYVPPGDVHLFLDFSHTDELGRESDIIADKSVCAPGAKYLAFIGTDNVKATFINSSITDGSACAVIKTSFGDPFAYFLTQHYQYVYVLDVRFYRYRSISDFVDIFNVSDVIIIHNSDFCADSEEIAKLKAFE